MHVKRPYIDRVKFLRRRCRGRSVLHLGCSSGRYLRDRLERGDLLHAVLDSEASVLFGVDIHADSLAEMRRLGFKNLYCGDVERLHKLELNEKFDVVVAGDLLEHLSCAGSMLVGVKRFLKPAGELVMSTNNAFGLHYQLRRWLGRYGEHPEHVCFYSPETLINLLERHGYEVLELLGAYTTPPQTPVQKALFMFGSPLYRTFPILAGTLLVTAAIRGN